MRGRFFRPLLFWSFFFVFGFFLFCFRAAEVPWMAVKVVFFVMDSFLKFLPGVAGGLH